MTDPTRSLVKKLCRILKGIDHIEKNGRNKEQGYDFVRESDVKAELRKLFADENVWPSPDVEDASYVEFPTKSGGVMHFCRLKVRITFEDGDSGEMRSCRVMGEAMDSGDKASNKALTAAVKVALLQSMLIPTGDDTENDPKPEPYVAKPPKPAEPPPPPKPTPEALKLVVDSFAALGVTVADLEKFLGWPLATASGNDMLRLKKHYADTRAAKKDPDESARQQVQAAAEKALGDVPLATVATTKLFESYVEKMRAAKDESTLTLILADAMGAKLTKADHAALNRCAKDRAGLLREAAARAKMPQEDSKDVPF